MPWKPILEGALRDRALEAIKAIADELPAHPLQQPNLASGKAGQAIYWAYMDQAGFGGGDRADALLGEAVEAVAETPLDSSLYSGFSGIAWAADHLTSGAEDAEDPNEEIDNALIEHLSQSPWKLDYDLIIGLVGHAVYALDRLNREGGRRCLSLVVDRLHETAIEVAGSPGVTWLTHPYLMIPKTREDNPEGYYNTGLAHGVPGVLAVLAAAVRAGVSVDKAAPLLERATAWLLSHRADGPEGGQFPYTVSIPPGEVRHAVRAAWCYGDPGVAAALLHTARSTSNRSLEQIALDVGRRVASRPAEKCGVVDGGLCHGAAGLALIYNRFYQASGDTFFADAARLWTERLLDQRKPNEGIGGFLAFVPKDDLTLSYAPDPGILTGSAGIGLTLLSLCTDQEPRWDRMLLTDVPPL